VRVLPGGQGQIRLQAGCAQGFCYEALKLGDARQRRDAQFINRRTSQRQARDREVASLLSLDMAVAVLCARRVMPGVRRLTLIGVVGQFEKHCHSSPASRQAR
jgi:hypothetical protein